MYVVVAGGRWQVAGGRSREDRRTDRPDGRTDRQTDRQTDKQIDRKTDSDRRRLRAVEGSGSSIWTSLSD
jgi:hypothetical protein